MCTECNARLEQVSLWCVRVIIMYIYFDSVIVFSSWNFDYMHPNMHLHTEEQKKRKKSKRYWKSVKQNGKCVFSHVNIGVCTVNSIYMGFYTIIMIAAMTMTMGAVCVHTEWMRGIKNENAVPRRTVPCNRIGNQTWWHFIFLTQLNISNHFIFMRFVNLSCNIILSFFCTYIYTHLYVCLYV